MKIDSSSGQTELSALTDRLNTETTVSGKLDIPSVSESPLLKHYELLSSSLESLLNMLKPDDKSHEILRGLLSLIPRLPVGIDGVPENTKDSRLLLQVLKQFREGIGESLPQKVLQELKVLEQILERAQLKDQEALILFAEDQNAGFPALRITEEKNDFCENEVEEKLTLQFGLDILGFVTVVLSRAGEKQNCRILTDQKESRNKIRKASSVLFNHIKKRQLRLDVLKIQWRQFPSDSGKSKKSLNEKKKRLDLWG